VTVPGDEQKDVVNVTMIRVKSLFHDTAVETIEELAELQRNFSETDDSIQTASILLCVPDN
jgi:hypothetical protein